MLIITFYKEILMNVLDEKVLLNWNVFRVHRQLDLEFIIQGIALLFMLIYIFFASLH